LLLIVGIFWCFVGNAGRRRIFGDFLVFCWRFFGVLLVFFGNVVDGGFLGDFLNRISWGSFVVISPDLQKFPAWEKKIAKKV
jgi:hypothetical protein